MTADSVQIEAMKNRTWDFGVARCLHGNMVAYNLSSDMAARFEIEATLANMSNVRKVMVCHSSPKPVT